MAKTKAKKTRKQFRLTHARKVVAPRLIGYEIQMFLRCLLSWRVSLQKQIPERWLQVTLSNARLEVTLVHARIMLDFFEKKSRKAGEDDVLSSDIGFPAKHVRGSKSLRMQINKRQAHLTYTRRAFMCTPEKKTWSPDVFRWLVKRCVKFLTNKDVNSFVATHGDDDTRQLWKQNLKDAHTVCQWFTYQ